jgi:starch-binding outer membrane protein, SusD/RagB family
MKQIKYLGFALLTVCFFAIASCKKNFFETPDPNGFEVVDSWEDEGAVGLFLNRTYALVIPQWPHLIANYIHNTSDEMNGGNTTFLYGQLTENSVTDIGTSSSLTANRYADIRRCNLAIDGLTKSTTLPAATVRNLKGQFYFLRAYSYFKLVRLYGGVPLVLNAQGLNDENLATPRSKTSDCIKAIAKDLDSAAASLPAAWTGNDIGKVTRAAALAVKGKTLLYWASPQFNITNDSQRWTDAYNANLAAYNLCVTDGYSLVPSYGNIFITEDNKEILLVRKYNVSRDLGNNMENVTRPFSETTAGSGSNQPTWNLAQAYTMNNGLPITDLTSGYSAVQYWLNRDPRFAATIAVNGDLWALSGKATRRQWTYTGNLDETAGSIITGFYCKRFCNTSTSPANAVYNSNTGGGSGMDWIEMRYAEVIANLAECANETGNLTEAKNMIRLLRVRAGIVAGTQDYGLALATDAASMRRLILNERQVEFALEGMRYYDVRRTRNFALFTNRMSYKVNVKLPYTSGVIPSSGPVAGRIYLDVLNTSGFKPRDTANLSNIGVYTSIFITPVIPVSLEGANAISLPDKYYVYPLPNLFTQTPIIQQTNGWAGGTFDPFQ